jgi:hypothetical protein
VLCYHRTVPTCCANALGCLVLCTQLYASFVRSLTQQSLAATGPISDSRGFPAACREFLTGQGPCTGV